MKTPLSWLALTSAVAVVLSLGAAAQARGPHERGCAILSPIDSPDPTGCNSANCDIGKKGACLPYYSPLVPVSSRWCCGKLVPYYCGYCPWGKHGAGEYGAPGSEIVVGPAGVPVADYGAFTGGTGKDDKLFWRMGGNGLVPYGTPQPPHSRPDIIDMIGAPHSHPGCP
jgi:hypothetical protein